MATKSSTAVLKARYAGAINSISGLEKSRVALSNELITAQRTKARAHHQLTEIKNHSVSGSINIDGTEAGAERHETRKRLRKVNNLKAKEKYYSRMFWDAKDTERYYLQRIAEVDEQIQNLYNQTP